MGSSGSAIRDDEDHQERIKYRERIKNLRTNIKQH